MAELILEFPSTQAARDHRHLSRGFGWIFEPEDGGPALLFPTEMPPIAIFHHPKAQGRRGRLIPGY